MPLSETCKLFICGVAVCAHFSGGQHWCFHFQAMATFVGVKHFKTELLPTMTSLCKDPHHVVRKTVASGFHEVSRQCGGSVVAVWWQSYNNNMNDYDNKYLCSSLSCGSS